MSTPVRLSALSFLFALSACSDVEDSSRDETINEVMTTVVLNFTADDGTELEFVWADPDNTANPSIDTIVLSDAADYTLSLSFLNELENPTEDVTPEIADEDDQHFVFITGSAVTGPATKDNPNAVVEHLYADEDDNGLPVGLDNDILTIAPGEGEFTVTLRHMPPQNRRIVKTADAPELVATEGLSAVGGSNDVAVTLPLTVE